MNGNTTVTYVPIDQNSKEIASFIRDNYMDFDVVLMEINPEGLELFKDYWSRPVTDFISTRPRFYSQQPILKYISRLCGSKSPDVLENMRAWDTLEPEGETDEERLRSGREKHMESVLESTLNELPDSSETKVCLVAGLGHERAIEDMLERHNLAHETRPICPASSTPS